MRSPANHTSEDELKAILEDLASKISSNQAAIENGNMQYTSGRLYDDKCIAEAKAAILAWADRYAAGVAKRELEDLEFVDWESYGDELRTNYDSGMNELIDPLVENYVKDRLATLSADSEETGGK